MHMTTILNKINRAAKKAKKYPHQLTKQELIYLEMGYQLNALIKAQEEEDTNETNI